VFVRSRSGSVRPDNYNYVGNHAKINKNLCSGAKIIKTRLEMTSK
jgi:hypothetical protein